MQEILTDYQKLEANYRNKTLIFHFFHVFVSIENQYY